MGGSSPGKTLKGIASDAAGVTTAGVVDIEKGKINLDPTKAGANWLESAGGGDTMKSFMPEIPKMPDAPNPAEQQKRAEAEAAKKMEAEMGARGRGLSSTVLGGSKSEDTSILRKKRLLGE
jgi:hypothetical protein